MEVISSALPVSAPLSVQGPSSIPLYQSPGYRAETVKAAAAPHQATLEICLVEDKTKQPVLSGHVIVETIAGLTLFAGEPDGAGCVRIQGKPDKYNVTAFCEGYQTRGEWMTVPSGTDIVRKTILLSKVSVFRGIVRNARGRPQPGAVVAFYQKKGSIEEHGIFPREVRSDSDGQFEASLRAEAIDKIYAFLPPHPMAELGPIPYSEGRDLYIEITLPPNAEVVRMKGRVLDDRGNPVIAELRLTAGLTSQEVDTKYVTSVLDRASTAFSDAEGRFLLEARPQPEGALSVKASGLAPFRAVIDLTKDLNQDIHLRRYRAFRLTVLGEDGQPTDLPVVGEAPGGTTVLFRDTPEPGDMYFAIEYPFLIHNVGNPRGFLTPQWIDSYREEIVMAVGTATILGQVFDEAGDPIQDFQVHVDYRNDENLKAFPLFRLPMTSECYSPDGSFVIENLIPGTATVSVSADLPDALTMDQVASGKTPRIRISITQDVILGKDVSARLKAVLLRTPEREQTGARSSRLGFFQSCTETESGGPSAPEYRRVFFGHRRGHRISNHR
jgi:hypothetical protein